MNKKFHKSHKFKRIHKSLRNLKSQAALEFLTTYAWAFLVILIMISALAYFGILNPSKLLPDRCNFGAEIGCEDFRITTDALDLKLKNNVGEPITIQSVTFSSESDDPFDCTGTSTPSFPFSDWGSGSVDDFSFTTCSTGDAGFVEGEKAKIEITLTYYATRSGETYTHEVAGDVFTTVT